MAFQTCQLVVMGAPLTWDIKPSVGNLPEPSAATKSQNSLSERLRTAPTSGEPLAPRAFWIWITYCCGGAGHRVVLLTVFMHGPGSASGLGVGFGIATSRMILSPSSLKIWFAELEIRLPIIEVNGNCNSNEYSV